MNTDNENYHKITNKKRQAVLVRSEIEKFTKDFFFNQDFIFVVPPTLHEAIANKKSEIYVPLYNGMYSLSSSNALYMGVYASEFKNVFTISKCFRDESDTNNHLLEFDILEVEMLDCSFDSMVKLVQNYIEFILNSLLNSSLVKTSPELKMRLNGIIKKFTPRIMSYKDFVLCLPNSIYDINTDISDVDYLMSKQLKDIVIIVDYPSKFATWTSQKKSDNINVAMNILLPGTYGELCEGCERTNDINLLQSKIDQAKASKIQWYIDAIKQYNEHKRSGFGLGIDRLVRWIIGAENIQDTRLFPRIKIVDKNV